MRKLRNLQYFDAQKYLTVALTFLILGVIFICLTVQDAISSLRTPIDFNLIDASQCKEGIHVTGDVRGTIGYYWESYNTINGVKQASTTERIYLIPFGTEGQFIGLNIGEYDFERFDNLETETYEFFEDNSIPEPLLGYEGYIKKCDGRMKSALEDAYVTLGGTGNVDDLFLPYYIEQSSSASTPMLIFGLGCMIVSVVFFVIYIKKLNDEKNVVNTYIGRVIFDRNDYISSQSSITDISSGSDVSGYEDNFELDKNEEIIERLEVTEKKDPFDTGEVKSKSTLRLKIDE